MSIYTHNDLYNFVEGQRKIVGDEAFVTRRQCNRLREMWCASIFAQGYDRYVAPCMVEVDELDEQRDYDFILHTHGSTHPFQVTEALDEGRKRNYEYRNNITGLVAGDGFVVSKYAHQRLASVLDAKIGKNYSNSQELNILVYANFIGNEASWATMVNNLSSQCSHFASVWIITGAEVCCISSGVGVYGFPQWKKISG